MTTTERPPTPTERRHLASLAETSHAHPFDGEPETIRLELAAGNESRRHPDREIVCHVLEGRLELSLGSAVHEVGDGDVIRFDGEQDISAHAQADTTALLVLTPRADD